MEQTEKELALLDRLYGLYTKVLSTIQGYSNKLWVEIQGQMESIVDQVEEFQNECRLLPRSLHDWEAYQVRYNLRAYLRIEPGCVLTLSLHSSRGSSLPS